MTKTVKQHGLRPYFALFVANRNAAVGAEDLRKARKLYGEALGFKPTRVEQGRVVYEAEHLTLYVVEGDAHPQVPCFTVENMGDEERLKPASTQ